MKLIRFRCLALVFAVALFAGPSAQAQDVDEDDLRIRAEQVVIQVDDEGRVLVDPAPRGDRVFFRRGPDGVPPDIEDFDFDFHMPDMSHIAPLLERFRFEMGDPLRESIEEHREVAELERESRDLARRARRAEGAERNELEADLRSHLDEIFARKLDIRQQRIANLEEKLAEDREELQQRRAARSEIIDRRLRSLMGEDDVLDW